MDSIAVAYGLTRRGAGGQPGYPRPAHHADRPADHHPPASVSGDAGSDRRTPDCGKYHRAGSGHSEP
ncbi:hypothetical protein [Candidatus Flexifilum breve]|uniref:hypothetical protein n=1 Tax=Candidatus Flexifilum breve TaxID=3140694 RepID=UPI0033130205